MAGVLFIVTILTKNEEIVLKEKYKLIKENNQFDTPSCNLKTERKKIISGKGSNEVVQKAVNDSSAQPPVQIKLNDEIILNDKHTIIGETINEAANLNARKAGEGLIISSRSGIRKKNVRKHSLDIPADASMEEVMQHIFERFDITNSSWTKANDGKSYQIIFTIQFDEKYEHILNKFHEWGIGDREGSTVSVVNCNAFSAPSKSESGNGEPINEEKINAQKQSAWNRFMNSVTARLNVAQIVRVVRQEASITFDFIILVTVAAILASFGLVEDSTVFLASSMLISPLMGPIIAAIFGTAINDKSLRTLGVVNELFGIFIATFVGFLFGVVAWSIDDRYGISDGLTTEMLTRCDLHSLLVGVLTAFASGAAAAIGILGGNTGSLVGVAISASILPPAVNSGLLCALVCLYKIYEKDGTRYNSITKTTLYSNDQITELIIFASVSMCLTILNIICIYVMGILVLKIKEVAPVISRNNRTFWKHDIKIARDFNMNGFDKDATIMEEYAALPKEDQDVLGLNYDFLKTINIDSELYQNTWSPLSNPFDFQTNKDNYTTIHKFERLINSRYLPRASLATNAFCLEEVSSTIFSNEKHRRATLPSESFLSHPQKYQQFNILSDIESDAESIQSRNAKKKRKFIVTPAEDPLNLTKN